MGARDSPKAARQGDDEAQYAIGKLDKDGGMSSEGEDGRARVAGLVDSRARDALGKGAPCPARTLPTAWV